MSFFIRKKGATNNNSDIKSHNKKLNNTDAKQRVTRPPLSKFGSKKRKFQNNNNNIDHRKSGGINNLPIPSKKKRHNEEISSDSEDSADDDNGDHTVLGEEELETAQEKKVRLAKLYLEEIERAEKQREEDSVVDEEAISKRLKDDVLEQEGRLKKEVADDLKIDADVELQSLRCPRHLKRSITCLAISPDDQFIYSGCKDGNLYKWSVSSGQKVLIVKKLEKLSKRKAKKGKILRNPDKNSSHASTITSIAISSDGKYLATGDLDNKIVIWNPDTLQRIHIFTGHRKPIRGLVFRRKTHMLYSCSDDRTVRIWSLDDMGYVETLFGHQDSVTSIDSLARERAISAGGRDGTIRVWKIVEESQLVYNANPHGNIDCVKLINEENFISSSDDGSVSLWNVNRKKPLVTVEAAHGFNENGGEPRWISSIASYVNTDLVATGSSDGFVRLWKCGERFKSLTQVAAVPCPGWINSLEFSKNGNFLVVGIGKEHRLGRWFLSNNSKTSLAIIPLSNQDKSNNADTDSDDE